MNISFSWTSAALLAGKKTVTRRDWQWPHYRKFTIGDEVTAYDFNPRNKGQKIGSIRIVSLDKQFMSDMPDSDYESEGFAYLHDLYGGYATSWESFERWRDTGGALYVVRFEPVQMRTELLLDEEWMENYRRRSLASLEKKFVDLKVVS